MNNPAEQLAELMNQRTARGPAGADRDAQIERVANALYAALGARAAPAFARKLRSWAQPVEDVDDLQQLAAVAFIRAWQEGRIRPDEAGQHTAESVSRYLWGLCNKIFLQIVRRQRDALELDAERAPGSLPRSSGLSDLLLEATEADEEQRLWEVLAALQGRCKTEDLVMAWLHGCGFSPGEICLLADVSINMPARALKRVGSSLKELLQLDEEQPDSGPGKGPAARGPGAAAGGPVRAAAQPPPSPAGAKEPWMDIPIELLAQKMYGELAGRMGRSEFRSRLLEQAAAAFSGPDGKGDAGDGSIADELAARRALMRDNGDWTWGLLSKRERIKLLQRDFGLLRGGGSADGGAAQLAALSRLRPKLQEIYQELNLALEEADLDYLLPCADHLASLLDMSSRFTEAQARYEALLNGARRLDSPRLALLALLGLSQAHWRLGSFGTAREEATAARELAVTLCDRRSEAASLQHLGAVETYEGNFNAAREQYALALVLHRETGNRWGEANTLNKMAVAALSQGELAEARELLKQALGIFRELGDRRSEANCLNNLGLVDNLQSDYAGAKLLHAQALSIYREIGERLGEANSLGNLGMVENELCNYAAASEHYSQALVVFRDLGDRRSIALTQSNQAAVEHDQGHFAAARELAQQSLELFRELGDQHGEARALHILANGELEQGRYSAACELYAKALTIRSALGAASGIVDSCPWMASALAGRKDFPAAAILLHGAQKLALELEYDLGPHGQRLLAATQAALDYALSAGELDSAELEALGRRGESMTVEELAAYAMEALTKGTASAEP
ncbi:tetratricopeptide repeat protein [bacterium]|nr:tetratricopeptide repeat protein [bacterium]